MIKKKKICLVVSSEMTIKTFLLDHLKLLCVEYDVFIVAGTNCQYLHSDYKLDISVIKISINRNINIISDFLAFIRLFLVFKKNKFDLIHSITPKAGLLSMIAGYISRIPVRIHIFTGQIWVQKKNIIRMILKCSDRLIVFFSTNILADSKSQMGFLIKEKIVVSNKISVLANGSISGVNIQRFTHNDSTRKIVRQKLNISDTDIVFLFIGRLKYDKGVLDLCAAFKKKFSDRDNAHLLIVGPDEERIVDVINKFDIKKEKLHLIPYAEQPEKYMVSADVLCLPSYREGFGNAIIEAASCRLPSIGSRIYGITDAILEYETGLLHTVGDINALASLMEKLYLNEELRNSMGKAAYERAKSLFSSNKVTTAWMDYYATLI
jgi:glycosyltransferase involved in cell wall biosynthesis